MFFLVFFNDYFVNYALLLKGAEVITPFHDTLVLMQLESQQRHSNVPFTNTDVAQKRRLYDRSLWCIATTLRASIQWRYCSRELEWHLPKTPKKKASLKTQKWISICFVGKNPIWRNLILHKTRCQSGKFLWDNITVKAFGAFKGWTTSFSMLPHCKIPLHFVAPVSNNQPWTGLWDSCARVMMMKRRNRGLWVPSSRKSWRWSAWPRRPHVATVRHCIMTHGRRTLGGVHLC